jgi:hypothetical protein
MCEHIYIYTHTHTYARARVSVCVWKEERQLDELYDENLC